MAEKSKMITKHMVASISGILENKENLKNMRGCITKDGATLTDIKQIRYELEKLQDAGAKFISFGNCPTFDPVKGCCCGDS